MTNQAIIEAFELCRQYGLHSSAFVMFGLPYETRAMMEETIGLIARIRPGRMRWAIFFPFPGTRSYTICKLGDLIDFKRMRGLQNYFAASCLKFDPETDLFIRKLQRTFHWHVNARADLPTSDRYARLVEEVQRMSESDWLAVSDEMLQRDRQISDELLAEVAAGQDPSAIRHYSIRYTQVMAVESDFVLAEQGGQERLGWQRSRTCPGAVAPPARGGTPRADGR